MDCALWKTRAFLSFSMCCQMKKLRNFLQWGFIISISVYLSLSQHSPYYCRFLFRITWLLGIVHHLILKIGCDILGTVAVQVTWLPGTYLVVTNRKHILSNCSLFFWTLGDGQVQETSIPKCNISFLETFGIWYKDVLSVAVYDFRILAFTEICEFWNLLNLISIKSIAFKKAYLYLKKFESYCNKIKCSKFEC